MDTQHAPDRPKKTRAVLSTWRALAVSEIQVRKSRSVLSERRRWKMNIQPKRRARRLGRDIDNAKTMWLDSAKSAAWQKVKGALELVFPVPNSVSVASASNFILKPVNNSLREVTAEAT